MTKNEAVKRDVRAIFNEAKSERGLSSLPQRVYLIPDWPGVTRPDARIVRPRSAS